MSERAARRRDDDGRSEDSDGYAVTARVLDIADKAFAKTVRAIGFDHALKGLCRLGQAAERVRQQYDLGRDGNWRDNAAGATAASFHGIIENLGDALLIVARSGRLSFANRAARELFRIHPSTDLGAIGIEALVEELPQRSGARDLFGVCPTATWTEGTGIRRDGTRFDVDWNASRFTTGANELTVVIVRDATRYREHERDLRRQVMHDSLTGLPNRWLFYNRLHHAIATAKRMKEHRTVVVLGIDSFVHINDSFGHAVGDAVLRNLGRGIKTAIREADTLARLRGDQFAVLASGDVGADGARALVGRVVSLLEQDVSVGVMELPVRASLAATVYPEDGVDVDELIRHADAALYRAKVSDPVSSDYSAPFKLASDPPSDGSCTSALVKLRDPELLLPGAQTRS